MKKLYTILTLFLSMNLSPEDPFTEYLNEIDGKYELESCLRSFEIALFIEATEYVKQLKGHLKTDRLDNVLNNFLSIYLYNFQLSNGDFKKLASENFECDDMPPIVFPKNYESLIKQFMGIRLFNNIPDEIKQDYTEEFMALPLFNNIQQLDCNDEIKDEKATILGELIYGLYPDGQEDVIMEDSTLTNDTLMAQSSDEIAINSFLNQEVFAATPEEYKKQFIDSYSKLLVC